MPDQPWIDSGPPPPPPGGGHLPPPNQPPPGGGAVPGPGPFTPPPGAPSPLAGIERLANISLALSILSLVCGGIILSVIAFVLASNAERKARVLGRTSSDGRIRTAKIVSIVATILWVVIFIVIIANNASQNS